MNQSQVLKDGLREATNGLKTLIGQRTAESVLRLELSRGQLSQGLDKHTEKNPKTVERYRS